MDDYSKEELNMNFKGKEYNIEVNKIEEPMLYGKVWFSQSMVAEILWRFKDQKGYGKKCDTPMVIWQPCAKDVGVSSDNWNIKERRNLFHWYVYNEVCELVGLQKIDLEAKEKELAQQAPKDYKKAKHPQQTVQAPVQKAQAPVVQQQQNSKVQQLLNSRVQLRGDQQTATPAPTQAQGDGIIYVWTDGACSGNPGVGGWAYVFRDASGSWKSPRLGEDGRVIRDENGNPVLFNNMGNGAKEDTTNNEMELMACIKALEMMSGKFPVELTTDSKYVVEGITKWINGWVQKGWVTSKKEPVANRELWEQLLALTQKIHVTWKWVKGHAGYKENEKCDTLARSAIDDFKAQQAAHEKQEEEIGPDMYDYLPEDDYPEEEG